MGIILPIDSIIFQRGRVETTNQICIDMLTGAKRREFSGMIYFITSNFIIPATPFPTPATQPIQQPIQQPYVKRSKQ